MHPAAVLTTLFASAAIAALPNSRLPHKARLMNKRATFCEKIMDPEPTDAETEARFDIFAHAFLIEKDIDAAFEYIAPEYIVSMLFTI